MKLTKDNLGKELERWFMKSIIHANDINLEDIELYDEVLNVFIYDYRRYFPDTSEILLEHVLLRLELVGILLYRLASAAYLKENNACDKYSLLGRFLSGFEIYYSALIGKGIKINHGIGTIIGARVTIGENVLLHQGVTIGDKNGERPVIKNNVTIYAGAKVLGGITIGNNAIIGANSVCMVNVPDGSIAIGIPAKILKR